MLSLRIFDLGVHIGLPFHLASALIKTGRPPEEVNGLIEQHYSKSTSLVAFVLSEIKFSGAWPPKSVEDLEQVHEILRYLFTTDSRESGAAWIAGVSCGGLMLCSQKTASELEQLVRPLLADLEIPGTLLDEIWNNLANENETQKKMGIEALREWLRGGAPDERANRTRNIVASANEVIYLRPNMFGLGLDLNALVKKFLARG